MSSRSSGDGLSSGSSEGSTGSKQPDEIAIEYIGGTSETNGLLEAYKPLEQDYIMKGYMLKITAPPIQPGTTVEWSIKKGAVEAGTYHQTGAWTAYNTPLQNRPTSRTIFWRSDADGSITDSYLISAKYTPPGSPNPVTVTRTVQSRLLDPTVPALRDNFNEDTDMVQRAMIQVFFIDKGRLRSYRIGKYDRGAQGYYESSYPRNVPQWSPIADEVENFDQFALNNSNHSTTLRLTVVKGIWEQFALILAKPLPSAVTDQHPDFNQWLTDAVNGSGISVPAGFPRTPEEVLTFQIKKENNGKHSGDRFDPLAVSSVLVGENYAGSGATLHTYTDDGIGFAKIQPYNRGTLNIFGPPENILRQGQMMKVNIDGTQGLFGVNERVWRAYVRYNAGSYFQNLTAAQLRTGTSTQQRGAKYADAIFNAMGIPLP